jgi:hypothetical protein
MKGSDCDVRRRCAGCYEKIRQEQSREEAMQQQRKQKHSVLIVTNFIVLVVSTRNINLDYRE